MMQSRSGTSDYATPTTQMIVMKGKACIEPISIPALVNYFTNMQLAGREYGYFKITHFDFPLNDSLTKIMGDDFITINFSVEGHISDPVLTPGENFPPPGTYEVVVFSRDIVIPVRRTHTLNDIAISLYNQIGTIFGQDPVIYTDENNWKSWLSDISYDELSQKIVFTLGRPAVVPPYTSPGLGEIGVPFRYIFRLAGLQTGRQAELAAALFGGVYGDAYDPISQRTYGWSSTFDTGNTKWFSLVYAGQDDPDVKSRFPMAKLFELNAQRPSRMFIDPYVYIHGSPDHSVWTPAGDSTDLMTIQPRNRLPGAITSNQAYIAQDSHSTKSSLQALRNMTLLFTDSKGRPHLIDEEYVIKISIDFQV